MNELERLRDEYIGCIAHDIRGPVGSISLHAELLARTLAPQGLPDAVRSARIIAENARRLSSMLHELCEVTQLESHHLALELQPVGLRELVSEALARNFAPHERRRIRVEPGSALPPVACDADRIERVIVNLLTNAIKYSPTEAAIDVFLAHGDDEVLVSVRDRGEGIAPEDRRRIFDKYERTNSAHAKESLGLGLYICRLLVQAHGGRIWVEGDRSGSTFVFTLPTLELRRGAMPLPIGTPDAAQYERGGVSCTSLDDLPYPQEFRGA